MRKVSIILVDWDGYRLHRKKKLGQNVINCGLVPLLDTLNSVEAGVDFGLHLIINQRKQKWFHMPFWPVRYAKPSRKSYESLLETYPFINDVHFRNNTGFDIGAYNFGFQLLQSQGYEGDVLFMNSSVIGPSRDNWLRDYQCLFYNNTNTGLCGITLNSHNTCMSPPVFAPHVQSFFIYTNTSVLSDAFGTELPGSYISEKIQLIREGEIGISRKVLEAGYSIRCSTFPNFVYRNGGDWTIPEGDIRFRSEYRTYANQVQPI